MRVANKMEESTESISCGEPAPAYAVNMHPSLREILSPIPLLKP